jgi:hypothetical protein
VTAVNILSDGPEDWWSDLPGYQTTIIRELLASGMSETEAAELWLSRVGPDNNFAFGAGSPGANFLASVQTEFRKFLCGDAQYEQLRQQANETWNGMKIPVVAAIAAGIGATVGVAAAVIMPVVALLLTAAAKIGLNAWCNLPQPPPAGVVGP